MIKKIKAALDVSRTAIAPLTAEDVAKAAKDRLSVINKEFKNGFDFIKKYPKSVTIFGSAKTPETDPYYAKARSIASKLSKQGYTIVTGGGPGIMEAANRGAFESGGQSVGLNIYLPTEQKENAYLTDHCEFYYFFSRKVVLSFAAEAYIYLPGGYGTLNEFFEIITLVQTQRITPVPVILVGTEYWQPLADYLKSMLLEKHQTISKEVFDIFTITDDEDKIVKLVLETPVVANIPFEQIEVAE